MAKHPSGDPQDEGLASSDKTPETRLDAEAASILELMFKEHAKAAYAYLRSRGMDAATAEDLVHEAFLQIGRHLRAGHSVGAPRAFVIQVVHRRWVRWLGSSVRRQWPSPDPGLDEPDESSNDDFDRVLERHDQQGQRALLEPALSQLPPRQATIVKMTHFGGMSDVEIAEELGIARGTVRYHLSRAHHRLKELLSQATGDEEGESE